MFQSEYVRNLNRNYERIRMEDDVDCRRYQYCILLRGGIKYLLPCIYKQIDDNHYLDYDISSSQNIKRVFGEKHISREWMKEFLWSIRRMRQELNRFLLDERSVIWSPDHIFQDLERKDFLFLYIPYYEKNCKPEDTIELLLEFLVDRVDYDDAPLVEFVYHVYEQFLENGYSYLEQQIFEDFDKAAEQKAGKDVPEKSELSVQEIQVPAGNCVESNELEEAQQAGEKKGIFARLGLVKKKSDNDDLYREELRRVVTGYAVCEETMYGGEDVDKKKETEEYGKTIYIEEKEDELHGLYAENGELRVRIDKYPFLVGKRKEDVDYVLSDYSASRVHARFVKENEVIYIEDLNSTNGTFKNGLRMQPYEKRTLETEDTLRFGKSIFVYR